MTDFVLQLDNPGVALATAGGKGANLARLIAAGLPVPSGFVLTTAAYRTFVQANGLQALIAAEWAAIQPAHPDSYEAASTAIRAAFQAGRLPAAVSDSLLSAYAGLGRGARPAAVAVRSSATAEDLADASFAGQQETFLNVCGQDALLPAVLRCWSSLWTARAMAYRARQGLAPESVALAVVVQPMVPARAAGVLFTLNPLMGSRDEIVVNATWGLGESLVSGHVNPDSLCLDKATGRIKSLDVGDKTTMTALTVDGTAEVGVPDGRRRVAVLTQAEAVALAGLARQIEALFAAPQDIEWALADDGQFSILQARPVTAVSAASSGITPGDDDWPPLFDAAPQPFDLWTQADVGERWPAPVTPLTWSTGQQIVNENMQDSLSYLRLPWLQTAQWARRAYGRVYFNEGLMSHLFVHEFGMPSSLVAAGFGSQGRPTPADDRWRWDRLLRRFPVLWAQGQKMDRDIKEFEKRFPQIDRWVDDFMRRDLGDVPDRDLWSELTGTWQPRAMDNMALHGSVTSVSMMNFPLLEGMLARWAGSKDLAYTLLTGLSGIIQAEIVPSLTDMARDLERLGLVHVVLDNAPADALRRLRSVPDAAPMLQKFDAFLQRHGHRCPTEAEWLNPRWAEAPELVIDVLAGYLRNGASQTAGVEQQRRQRELATAEVMQRLDPLRRRVLQGMLSRVQHLVRMRDNGQNYLVKLLLPIRRIYAVLAERWAQRGLLGEPSDFFFLVVPEIEAILKADGPAPAAWDTAAIVARRRQAYAHWGGAAAPEVLDCDGRPVQAPASASADSATLTGVAASAGAVTGTARIVLSPRDAGRLRPGDILVTRATDPGWTPAFSVIGGLVLEVGGLLSHGAIVAREYGLPAVVNVSDATRLITDGQTIAVNGSQGKVRLA